MRWKNGDVFVKHPRETWDPAAAQTLVHCRLESLKGTDPAYGNQRATYHEAYSAAKKRFDMDIAFDVVERCVSDSTIDQLADVVFYTRQAPVLVFPHPAFDDEDGAAGRVPDRPTNALPFAYAEFLAKTLGAEVNETIFQSARVGRTHLPRWLRYLCQPTFEGAVEPGRAYILVDDVISTGGTFAALRSYIIRNGGSVAGATCLANKDGLHEKFAIADQTLVVLRSTYGNGLAAYWKETFGHGIDTLTEAEAQFLALFQWGDCPAGGDELLQRVRERINQAAATGG